MNEANLSPIPQPLELCSEHQQPIKWHCGVCGKPLCSACKPIGLNYQVFHRQCVAQAHNHIEHQDKMRAEIEAPSLGVKTVAWFIIIAGMVAFGLGLLLIGLSWFSRTIPIRVMMSSPVPLGLDAVPGSRVAIQWIGIISIFASALLVLLGVGLINCVKAARRLVLVFSWLEVIIAVIGWLAVWLLHEGFWDIPIWAIFFIWFFSRDSVKKQFEKVL